MEILKVHPDDNVLVALRDLPPGTDADALREPVGGCGCTDQDARTLCALLALVLQVASGEVRPRGVRLGQADFIPWKQGISH